MIDAPLPTCENDALMKSPTVLILLLNLIAAPGFAQKPTPIKKPAAPAAPAAAETTPQTELVLKSLSERYEKLRMWKAKFTHSNYSTAIGTTKTSEGDFIFAYPNRFRFTLNGPSVFSDFISDGQQAWYVVYPKGRKEAAQVNHFKDVTKLELDKYLIILRGVPSKKDFKITSRVDDKNLTLILEPRKSDELEKVELGFEQLKDFPSRAVMTDSLGGESTVTLRDAERVTKLDPEEFKAKYPKGSRVESN